MSKLGPFKENITGFRKFVSALENWQGENLVEEIKEAKVDDIDFSNTALKYVITWDDIAKLEDRHLHELLNDIEPKEIAKAIQHLASEKNLPIIDRLPEDKGRRIHAALTENYSLEERKEAYLKLIQHARQLEKSRKSPLQRIPDDILDVWRED